MDHNTPMVINEIKQNNFWLKNSLPFDGRHRHHVISIRPSKHLWFLTTFVIGPHQQNKYKNYLYLHPLLFKSLCHIHK